MFFQGLIVLDASIVCEKKWCISFFYLVKLWIQNRNLRGNIYNKLYINIHNIYIVHTMLYNDMYADISLYDITYNIK